MSKRIFLIRNIFKTAYGGAERYQIDLGKILQKNGYEPIVVSSSIRLLEEAKRAGLSTIKAPYCPQQNWSSWRNLLLPLFAIWESFLFCWYVIKIIKFKPDILQIQSRDDMLAGTLAGRFLGKRVIWTDHADLRKVVWENLNVRFKNPIGKFIYKIANKVSFITEISDFEYNYVNELTNNSLRNLVVIKNGKSDVYDPSAKKVFTRTIGYIGRLSEEKGLNELIRAFNNVSKQYPDTTLEIYGDGPMHDFIKSNNNPNIKLMGYIEDVSVAYNHIDIFILPSYFEGLSLSLIEASMFKKCIIATNVDGNPEIVQNKKSGLLIPPKKPKAIEEAIIQLFDDEKLRTRLANGARKSYEKNFNFDKIIEEQLIPLYES